MPEPRMNTYRLSFDGQLLTRGFWLYVWRVIHGTRTVLYVGRTGDSSSRYAASPFSRVGQHLDLRPTAKANALLRNLRSAGLDPKKCRFELIAHGPLFREQTTLEAHRKLRDRVAEMEAHLADGLRDDGYHVLGVHPRLLRARGKVHDKVLAHFRSILRD